MFFAFCFQTTFLEKRCRDAFSSETSLGATVNDDMGTGEGHTLSQLLHYMFSFLLCLCRVALAPRILCSGHHTPTRDRALSAPNRDQISRTHLWSRDRWGVQCSHREPPAAPTDGHFVTGAVGMSREKEWHRICHPS